VAVMVMGVPGGGARQMAPYYPLLIGLLVLAVTLSLVGLLERFVWNKRQCPEAIKHLSAFVCWFAGFSAACMILAGLWESGRRLLAMWHWLTVVAEALAVVFMVCVWFWGLVTFMVAAWAAVDRYMNGTQKDRRVIGFVVLLLAVSLWVITTFR